MYIKYPNKNQKTSKKRKKLLPVIHCKLPNYLETSHVPLPYRWVPTVPASQGEGHAAVTNDGADVGRTSDPRRVGCRNLRRWLPALVSGSPVMANFYR